MFRHVGILFNILSIFAPSSFLTSRVKQTVIDVTKSKYFVLHYLEADVTKYLHLDVYSYDCRLLTDRSVS